MSLRAALAAALLLPAAALSAADLPPSVAELAGLLPGSYASRDAGTSVRFAVAAVPRSRIAADGPVFYVEGTRAARPGVPFLQRFLKLEADGSRVAIRVFEPRDLAGVRGKWREPEALALFTARDVRERPDCRMTLAKAPAGNWAGGTPGATCFSAAEDARLAVTVSLSPQTLEWREEGRGAAGKTVLGPAGEITIYGREREAPVAPVAVASPVAGGAAGGGGFSSKVNGAAAEAAAVLTITSPSSPSKKYDLEELRALAANGNGFAPRNWFLLRRRQPPRWSSCPPDPVRSPYSHSQKSLLRRLSLSRRFRRCCAPRRLDGTRPRRRRLHRAAGGRSVPK